MKKKKQNMEKKYTIFLFLLLGGIFSVGFQSGFSIANHVRLVSSDPFLLASEIRTNHEQCRNSFNKRKIDFT